MARGDIQLALKLTADGKGFVGQIRLAKKELDKLTRSTGKAAGAGRKYAHSSKQITTANRQSGQSFREAHARALKYFALIGGTAVISRAVSSSARLADSYTEINNRLRLVTDSEEQLIAARQQLLALSQATRTGLAANAQLFSRLALAAENTGKSQTDLLKVTELLNKQVSIGGNNATEAAAGLTQFAQGIASGRLQGDELRSVLENLQGVSAGLLVGFRRLREQGQIDFDVTRANIRELAAEGVLSSQLLLDAILASAEDTESKFSQVATTVSGATVQLRNSLLDLVGELDKSGQFSARFAESLTAVSKRLDQVDVQRLATALSYLDEILVLLIARVAGPLVASFVTAGAKASLAAVRTARLQLSLAAVDGVSRRAALGLAITNRALAGLKAALALLGGPAGLLIIAAYAAIQFAGSNKKIKDSLQGLPGDIDAFRKSLEGLTQAQLKNSRNRLADQIAELSAQIEREQKRLTRTAEGITVREGVTFRPDDRFLTAYQAKIDTLTSRLGALKERAQAVDQQLSGVATAGNKTTAAADSKKQQAADLALLKDQIKRQKAVLQQALDDRLVSIENYYKQKAALDIQAIDAELAIKKQALKSAKEDGRYQIERDLIILQGKRADVSTAAARAQKQAEEQLAEALDSVRQRLADIKKEAPDVRATLTKELADLRAQLTAEGNSDGLSLLDQLIDVSVAEAKFNALEQQFNASQQRLAQQQQNIQAQLEAALITQVEARQRILQLERESLIEAEKLIPLLEQASQASGASDTLAQIKDQIAALRQNTARDLVSPLAGARRALADYINTAADAARQTEQLVSNAFSGMEDALTQFVTTSKLSFKDLADSIIKDLIRIAIQRAILGPLANALFGGVGSAAGGSTIAAGPAGGYAFGVGYASGGLVRGPGTSTSDSVPARLSNNEYVIQAEAVRRWGVAFLDMINGAVNPTIPRRAYAAGGLVNLPDPTARPVRVEIKNQGTPQRIADAQATVTGRDLVVSVITSDARNNGPITQTLSATMGVRR